MKVLIMLLTMISLSSTTVLAEGKKAAKHAKADDSASYGGAPWGMAGCSIWNYVIKSKEQGPQIGVWALENFVFGVQTFAISSGTSNCVNSGGHMAQSEQEVFVNVNMASLQKEAAQGQGEHLATLAEIFGCDSKVDFAQLSQNRYEAIFNNEDAGNIIKSYKSEIKKSKLSASCSRAS